MNSLLHLPQALKPVCKARVYAHIFEADREKVAANVNRAVNEVHEMYTDPLETEIMSRSKEPINPSHLRFYLQTGNQVDSGTSDYEFRSDDLE